MIFKKDSFRFFLALSLFLHVGLSVLALVLSNTSLFQSRNKNRLIESSIQIDQIDLSNLKKISSTDLTKIPKAKPIKKEKKKKKKLVKKAKEKKEVIIKKETEKEKEKEQDKIDTEKKERTEEDLKPEEQDSKQKDTEQEETEQKETEQEDTEQEEETIPQELSGEEQGGSHSSELNEQEISEISYYANQISNKVKNNWKIPSYLKDKSFSTEVEIKINTQGRIISKKIIRSSGDDFFDSFVLKAVEKGEPYPIPPLPVQKIIADGIVLNFSNL